jgi:hypothetical protein
MFGSVAVSTHSIQDYVSTVRKVADDELRRLPGSLESARILMLSTPGAGGAATTLLQSSVPMVANLASTLNGIKAVWPPSTLRGGRPMRRALFIHHFAGYLKLFNQPLCQSLERLKKR